MVHQQAVLGPPVVNSPGLLSSLHTEMGLCPEKASYESKAMLKPSVRSLLLLQPGLQAFENKVFPEPEAPGVRLQAGSLNESAQRPLQATSGVETMPGQQTEAIQQQQVRSQTTSNGLSAQQVKQSQLQTPQPQTKQPQAQLQKGLDPSNTLIHVSKDFKAVEGTMLTEGLFVGRKLGGGMQVSKDVSS